jgi:tRNA G37 N-methylase Trm5
VNEKSVTRFLLKRLNLTSDLMFQYVFKPNDATLRARVFAVFEDNKDIVDMFAPVEVKSFIVSQEQKGGGL